MSEATVITSATNKGGGGKTTLQLVLAAEAARAGHRVLVVDLDRNRALSSFLGLTTDVTEGAGYRLAKDQPFEPDVRTLGFGGVTLDVVPMGVGFRNHYFERALDNDVDLSGVDRRDADAVERVRYARVRDRLEGLKRAYDYVFLDVQNEDSDLAMNALYASDVVLAPVTPDPVDVELAMTGLRHVWQLHRDHRPGLAFGGIVLNRVDRAFHARQAEATRALVHPALAEHVFGTTLRRAPAVLKDAYVRHAPPNLTPRASASGARDGSSFATDCSALWDDVTTRLTSLRADGDAWSRAFRAFAADAEARQWQRLVDAAPNGGARDARTPVPVEV